MSGSRYPSYKETGLRWLGEIPTHWDWKPLWTFFRRVKRLGCPDEELLSVYREFGVIPKSSRDDNFNKPSDDLSAYQLVLPNDLVVNKMKAWQGSVAVSHYRGIVSPAYFVYTPLHNEEPRYLHYLMRSLRYVGGYLSLSKGIRPGQWDIDPEAHSRMPLLVPPREEQRGIAMFLDSAVERTDALINEQERLIELLTEKRQAVISHAVTKGLSPDAPMKPSGVEWLGEVPAHWTLCLLKRAFRSMEYGLSDALTPEGSVAVLRMGNIQRGEVSLTDLKYIETVDPALLLAPDDLLFNRTNSLDLVGKVGLFRGHEAPTSFASYLVRLKASDDMLPEYLAYLLNTDGLLGVARSLAFVAIGQCNLNPTRYGHIRVALPPQDEQREIVRRLSPALSQLDRLLKEAESAITILEERRTALISAAVTGQIAVRGYANLEVA